MADVLLIAGKLNNRENAQRLGKIEPSDNPILTTLVSAKNLDIDNNGAVTRRDGRVRKHKGQVHSLWVHPKDDSTAYFVGQTNGTPVELLENGTFDADENWDLGAGWTIEGGKLVATSAASSVTPLNSTVEVGKYYRCKFTGTAAGFQCVVRLGGNFSGQMTIVFNGTFTWTFKAVSTVPIELTGVNQFTGTFDDISIWEVEDPTGVGGTPGLYDEADPVDTEGGDPALKKLNADFSSTLVTELNSNAPMAYEMVNQEIVISNGTDIGWLKETTYDAFAPSCEEFEVPMSAGQYLSFHKGCLYVANGSVLEVSKPHDVERRDERYSLFPMAARIGMLAAVDDGLWISHKEVGFISGKGVDGLEYVHVTDATPPDGCFAVVVEDSEDDVKSFVLWASEEGFCKGGSGESYTNQSFGDVGLPEGEYGSLYHRFKNGIRQYIAVIHKPDSERTYTNPDLDITESTI